MLTFPTLSGSGAILGSMLALMKLYEANNIANNIPGITPATKSFPIESSVIIPQTINKTLGGINIPKQALPAIEPRAKL